jgi:hypothetical protein
MEQRPVIRFFTLKRLKARAIHTELESVYDPETRAPLIMEQWWRDFHQGRTDLYNVSRFGKPLTNDPVGAIGPMLKERPFSSCKVLYCHFWIGKVTGLPVLHDRLGLKTFHLRWVPHALSISQQSERVSYSKFLLTELVEQKASRLQEIITGDEPWFFFYYSRDSI